MSVVLKVGSRDRDTIVSEPLLFISRKDALEVNHGLVFGSGTRTLEKLLIDSAAM